MYKIKTKQVSCLDFFIFIHSFNYFYIHCNLCDRNNTVTWGSVKNSDRKMELRKDKNKLFICLLIACNSLIKFRIEYFESYKRAWAMYMYTI